MNMFDDYTQASPVAGGKGKMSSPMSKPMTQPVNQPRPTPKPASKPTPMPAPQPQTQPQQKEEFTLPPQFNAQNFGIEANKPAEADAWRMIVRSIISSGANTSTKENFLRAVLEEARRKKESLRDPITGSLVTKGPQDSFFIMLPGRISQQLAQMDSTNLPPAWS
jgi:hypothetical protein